MQGWVRAGHSIEGEVMAKSQVFAGIDVAQATLEVAVRPTREAWQLANDEIAFGDLVERLRQLKPSPIVLEATGGIHLPVVAALAAAKLPIAAINPRQVRDFAKATGKLAKTDRIDAQVLAHFAEAVRPEVRPLPDAATQELAFLVARRRQLMEMRVAEQSRSRGAPARIRSQIREHVEWLNRQIDELDRELGQRVRSSPAWRERDELFRSAPGVGPVLSTTLLADLPELGTVSHKVIAALVGLAPLNQDSGKKRGKRVIWGWPCERARSAVHGYPGSYQAQSRDPDLLPAPPGHAQAEEAGAHRVHAQAPQDPERHGSTANSMVCTWTAAG
jgi:transposase